MIDDGIRAGRHIRAGGGEPILHWLGGRFALKLREDDTEGRFALFEIDDPRGSTAPLHRHSQEDEVFMLLAGTMRFAVEGQRIEAGAGDVVYLPRGTRHTYLVTSERAHALVLATPAGFERFFLQLGTPIEAGVPARPPTPEEMARVLVPYGCEIVGPALTLD